MYISSAHQYTYRDVYSFYHVNKNISQFYVPTVSAAAAQNNKRRGIGPITAYQALQNASSSSVINTLGHNNTISI